jgi:hypothetical protein
MNQNWFFTRVVSNGIHHRGREQLGDAGAVAAHRLHRPAGCAAEQIDDPACWPAQWGLARQVPEPG